MPVKAATVRQIAWSLAAYLVPAVATLVMTPFVVRGLGTDRYGLFVLAMTTVGFLAVLDLGLTTAATREFSLARVAADPVVARQTLATTTVAYAVLAVTGGGVLWLAAPWLAVSAFALSDGLQGPAIEAFHIAAVGLFVNLLLPPYLAWQRAADQLDAQGRIGITATVIGTVGTWWSGVNGDLAGALWFQVASSVVTLAASVWSVHRREPERTAWVRPSIAVLRRLAGFAGFQLAGQVAGTIGQHIGRLLVARLLGPTELTWYSVPFTLLQRIQKLLEAATRLLFPRIAQLSVTNDAAAVADLYRRAQKVVVVVGFALCLPLGACGRSFLLAWLDPTFADHAALPMLIVAVGYAIGGAGVAYVSALLGLGRARDVLLVEVTITAIQAALLWPLGAWLGVDGIALAFLGGWSGLLLGEVFVRRRLGKAASAGLGRLILGTLAVTVPISLAARWLATWSVGFGVLGPLTVIGLASLASLAAVLGWPALFGTDADLALQLRAAVAQLLARARARWLPA